MVCHHAHLLFHFISFSSLPQKFKEKLIKNTRQKRDATTSLAYVASISVGFGSFGVLPARKMEREPKIKYPSFLPLPLPLLLLAPFSRCNYLLPNLTETLATQATTFQPSRIRCLTVKENLEK